MNDQTLTADVGPASVAASLLALLQQERETLARLSECFEAQLAAMRTRVPERLEAATLSVTEEVGALARIQQNRERQMRLLARVLNLGERPAFAQLADALQQTAGAATITRALLDARDQARKQAETTQERCRELEFALNYASDLGRDMLLALQGTGAATPTLAYTAKGHTAPGTGMRSFVNRQG